MNDEQRKLVEENMGLVYHVLKTMNISQKHDDYDDLVQEGTIGLIKAVENFNSELDVKFATYAVPNIKGYVCKYFRDFQARKISMPRIDYYIARKFLTTKDYEVVCNDYQVTREKVDECLYAYNSIMSINYLQQPVSNDACSKDITLEEVLVVGDNDIYESLMDRCDLFNAMETLDYKQKHATYMFYIKGYNQIQIAKLLDVSQVQVSRILSKSKDLLRDILIQCDSVNDKRVKHLVTYNNKTLQIEEWSKLTGIKYHTIAKRIARGWDLDRVFHNKQWDKEVI